MMMQYFPTYYFLKFYLGKMVLCFIGLSWKTFITRGSFTDSTTCKKMLWSEAFSGKLQYGDKRSQWNKKTWNILSVRIRFGHIIEEPPKKQNFFFDKERLKVGWSNLGWQ